MTVEKHISRNKEIYNSLLQFIENEEEVSIIDSYQILINQINTPKNINDRDNMLEILQLISKISSNYHRNPDFLSKIIKIILHFSTSINPKFTNLEIFNIFKSNKQILLYLFNSHLIQIDGSVVKQIFTQTSTIKHQKFFNDINSELEKFNKKNQYFYYDIFFYQEIKDQIDETMKEEIEQKAMKLDPTIFTNFEEKRKIGENENYICEMIRNDSVKEFITYVNKTNLSLKFTKIKPSVFETNPFLIKNFPSLIEYAAFYGSIQIFQYLQFNNAELTSSLWLYAIHGKNAKMIHFLEENRIRPPNNSYKRCLKEAIKCHHNDIANYIINNLIKQEDEVFKIKGNFKENIKSYSFHYHNYFFYPTDIEDKYAFLYACQFNYVYLVKLYLKYKKIDVNYCIIQNIIIFKQR